MANKGTFFQRMRRALTVFLIGIWIILPSSPFLIVRLVKDADLGFFILAAILWPSLTAIVETLVISTYYGRKSAREISAIVPLGWLAQYFLFVIVFDPLDPDPSILLLAIWFILPYVIVQAAAAAAYAGFVWLGTFRKLKFFANTWFRSIALILLICALTLGRVALLAQQSKKVIAEAT